MTGQNWNPVHFPSYRQLWGSQAAAILNLKVSCWFCLFPLWHPIPRINQTIGQHLCICAFLGFGDIEILEEILDLDYNMSYEGLPLFPSPQRCSYLGPVYV